MRKNGILRFLIYKFIKGYCVRRYINIIFLVLCVSGCLVKKDEHQEKRLSIVCTTTVIADMVSHIVGEYGVVESLMGPEVDPHLYHASAGDAQRLAHADIIFYNGLHLEGKMADLLESLQQASAITTTFQSQQLLSTEFSHIYDPHVWHDVVLWSQVVYYIADILSQRDSLHADEYASRAATYGKQLVELDAWVRRTMATVSAQHRILVTAHDAFRYFGRAYAMEVVGVQGVSTESDVGIKDLQQLTQMIVDKKIPAIFVESSVSQRSIHALRNAVAARGWQVEMGASLLSDALGSDEHNNTYIGMIRSNVQAIVTALGGECDD